MKKFVLFFVLMFFVSTSVWAQEPKLMLPLPANETWILTRAYNAPPTHIGADRYALDFTQAGCESWNKPIFAAAPGIVEVKSENDYGKNIYINHGNGYKTHYAHLESIIVSDGQSVSYNTQIGTCGNTGNVSGSACPDHPGTHLHFKMLHNGNPVKLEPISGYTNFPDGEPGSYYYVRPIGHFANGWHDDGTSQDFVDEYQQLLNQGHNLGDPYDNGPGDVYVHEVNGMLIQDFHGLNNNYDHPHTALISGPNGVKLLKEGFWDFWMNHIGWEDFGPPINEEESGYNYARQNFRRPGSSNDYDRYLVWSGGNTIIPYYRNGQVIPYSELRFTMGSVAKMNKMVLSADNGIYSNDIKIANFDQTIELVDGQTYDGFYAIIDGEEAQIDPFTVYQDMTVVIDGEDAPVAGFSATPTFGVAPLTVQFDDLSTNNPNDWWWEFGDGNTSTSQVPSHTYSMPGIYSVSFTASNSGGSDTEIKTSYITVTEGLVVDFVADVRSGSPPLTVQFTDQSSGNFTHWYWYFGDGNTSDEKNPSHTYYVAGSRTVTLVASNIDGSATKVKEGYITVTGANPVDFTVSREDVGFCDCVAFTSQVDVPVDSYHWDFGDGESSSYQNPGHTYDTQGVYDVTLTITNQEGSFSKTKENHITVGECLVSMSANINEGELPLEVSFQGSSPGSPTFWAWDFGDGEFAFAQNPTHVYTEPGTYDVQMSVLYSQDSALILREAYISVTGTSVPGGEPMAFEANVTEGTAPLPVTFSNQSTIEPVLWFWDFGDGSQSMTKHASHTYTSPGVYSVTLYAFMPSMETLVYENYINVSVAKRAQITETKLNGNYPNPFNPSTTINFSLDKAQSVSINIYDVSGRRVKQLVGQVLDAGAHSVQWLGKDQSGQNVSTGIYFVQMRTEQGTEVKKITLLK